MGRGVQVILSPTQPILPPPINLSNKSMKGRRSERINRSPDEFIGVFMENSGTSENEWSSSSGDEQMPVRAAEGKRIRLVNTLNADPRVQPTPTTSTSSLQIKLKMPRTPPPKQQQHQPQVIKLPKDMDPEPVCPICLKIIIGDLDDINEHVDECIGPSSNASFQASGTVTPLPVSNNLLLPPTSHSLVNVDEDDFGYGKDQYTEADIEKYLKQRLKQRLKSERSEKSDSKQQQKKQAASRLAEDHQETRNTLLIQSILSTVPPSPDFASLQTALKSLLDRIALAPKCAVCWETMQMPATVSVNCWHVCCEGCWLETLGNKRLCPHCSAITNPSDLRKVFF